MTLELELLIVGRIRRGLNRYRGTIRCVQGGRTSAYAVQLYGLNEELVSEGVLQGHPRWSEPLTGLLARCIAVAEPAHASPIEPWRVVTLVVRQRRRLLMEVQAINEDGLELQPGLQRKVAQSAWQVMRWQLANDAWDQTEPPPMPEPLHVPVYSDGVTLYCRIIDLPSEARARFEEWSIGRPVPSIRHVDDAAFPDDIDAYFGRGTSLFARGF